MSSDTDTGKEGKPFVAEPLEDPFEAPRREPLPEPVEAPEPVRVGSLAEFYEVFGPPRA